MGGHQRTTFDSVARQLLGFVPDGVQDDLRAEDIVAAIEIHYEPVRTQAIPAAQVAERSKCSTDGYYEANLDPVRPWILYADDVAPARVRFTLLHELGHHLLAGDAAELLDAIDVLGDGDADAAEEQVCHRFASLVLIPDAEIGRLAPPLTPEQVSAVKKATGASWEATAVRLAAAADEPLAVLLVRDHGTVSFAASSPRLGPWWPRGSRLDPHGPLRRLPARRLTARKEIYRFGLGGARSMFADAEPASTTMAVAVLRDRPSDGHFEILDEPEQTWKERLLYCEVCSGERSTGWCGLCRAPFCDECERCGCAPAPKRNTLCDHCKMERPKQPGAAMCYDCEADFG